MSRNLNLNKAKKSKNDECYTRLVDIEKELSHYTDLFRGKVVYCNCDDPTWSAFWQFFHLHFSELGLRRLISTHYEANGPSYRMDYTGGADTDISAGTRTTLKGNGDFRSAECEAILDEVDIVCSNPPFSLFRVYVMQLIEHDKQFLVIGSINAATTKRLFLSLKNRDVWIGYHHPTRYLQPDGTEKKLNNIVWYTNLGSPHNRQLTPKCIYDPQCYPQYDNLDAIEVNQIARIPMDYKGVMGVPVSFIEFYNPDEFAAIGHEHDLHGNGGAGISEGQFMINGEGKFKRILIQRK